LHPVLDDVFDVVEEAGDGALQALDYDCSLLAYRHIQGQHPLKAENCGPALKLPEAPLKIRQRTSAVDESARVGAWHLPLYAMDPSACSSFPANSHASMSMQHIRMERPSSGLPQLFDWQHPRALQPARSLTLKLSFKPT
jgi:uncharacterized protein involved in copper resistance